MLRRFAHGLSGFVLFACCAAASGQVHSNPIPFLDQPLVPTSVAPGGPELTLTVHGAGFSSASVVNWNGVALPTSYVSSSQLKATVPAANTAQAGTASITVSSFAGIASNEEFFFISKPTSPTFTPFHVSVPPLPIFSAMSWPAVADVNGDGKLDLVGGYLNEMAVLLGNGDGSFRTPTFFPLFGGTAISTFNTATVTGDFNGDGKPDFAFSSINTNVIAVVLGKGDGTFAAPQVINLQANYVVDFLYAADLNGDGRLDLISGNNLVSNIPYVYNANFAVCLGNGDGTFQPPSNTQISNSSGLGPMAMGDVNNDGKLDLIAGTNSQSLIFLGNGDGTFASPISSQSLGLGEQWLFTDLNGDGNLDVLALEGGQAGSFNIYPGDGAGGFTSAGSYAINGDFPDSLAMADINADGKLDVAAASANSQELVLLLGNGDGTF